MTIKNIKIEAEGQDPEKPQQTAWLVRIAIDGKEVSAVRVDTTALLPERIKALLLNALSEHESA